MTIKKVTFNILRYKPGHIDPPRFQQFVIEVDPQTSVLDGLEVIQRCRAIDLHHQNSGTGRRYHHAYPPGGF